MNSKRGLTRGDYVSVGACAAMSVVAAVLIETLAAGEPCFPIDDAWVHLVYARNLAGGTGYSFNAGDHFVAGTTSILTTLLLAVPAALGVPLVIAAEALSALALLGTCLLTMPLARRMGMPPIAAKMAGLLTAFSGYLHWSSVSGMETTLFAFALVTVMLIRVRPGPLRHGNILLSVSLAAFSGWIRPDAFLLAGLLAAEALYAWHRERRERGSTLVMAAWVGTIWLAIFLPYVLTNFISSGVPFCTSFGVEERYASSLLKCRRMADVGLWIVESFKTLPVYLAAVFRFVRAENVLLVPLAAMGALRIWSDSGQRTRTRPLVVAIGLCPLLRMAILGSTYMGQMNRHLHGLIPLLNVLALAGLYGLTVRRGRDVLRAGMVGAGALLVLALCSAACPGEDEALRRPRLSPAGAEAFLAAGIVVFVLLEKVGNFTRCEGRQRPGPWVSALAHGMMILAAASWMARSVSLFGYIKNTADMHLRLAHWVAQNTPADARIAIHDKEAMKFYTNRTVIHLGGRTNPEIKKRMVEYRDRDYGILVYLGDVRPDYIVFGPAIRPVLAAQTDLFRERFRVEVADNIHIWENPQVLYQIIWPAYHPRRLHAPR